MTIGWRAEKIDEIYWRYVHCEMIESVIVNQTDPISYVAAYLSDQWAEPWTSI